MIHCTTEPKKKATATERKMAMMTCRALEAFSISSTWRLGSSKPLSIAIQKEAPRSSKTMETVVEVGSPSVLKMLIKMMSVTTAAKQMVMTSWKVK